MQSLKQYLYNPLCLSCGSFFVKDHMFCDGCFDQKILLKMEMKNKSLNQNSDAFFLLNWVPFESDMLSETVYRLKSDKCLAAWKFYAENAAEQLADNINLEQVDYIVPIPGSKSSSVHSHVFAHYLSRSLRKPVLDILCKPLELSEQKRKNKLDRLYKTIQLREQFTDGLYKLRLKDKHILIVDDILTTGSSFNQSVQALGPIKKATLLTLFYRTANPNTVLVS